jgi:outer membrane protein
MKGLVTTISLFLLLHSSVFCQAEWDLKKCVDYALTNNISVKQADLQTRFAALNLTQDRFAQMPDANFQTSSGYRFGLSENPRTGILERRNSFNTQFGFSTNITIFNWFSKRLTIEASDLSLQASQAQVRKVQDDVALNVAVSYLQALLAKQQVQISSIQVQQTSSQLELTRKKVNAGVLPELNAAVLEAQLASDSSDLVTAQANVQQLLLQMKALLNLDAATPFDIGAPPVELIPLESLVDLQPEVVYNLAVVNLPQQRVNDLQIKAAEKTVKAMRGNMYPSVAGFGQLNTVFVNTETVQSATAVPRKVSGDVVNINGTDYPVVGPGLDNVTFGITPFSQQLNANFGQNLGIGITVPLLNGRTLRSNWERSKLNVRQLQLQKESDNQVLKQDIYRAYNDATASLQKFNASKKTVEAEEKVYNFAKKRYDLNLLSSYELVNTLNSLNRARTDMLLAQFDYVFKMKLLEFYKGQGLRF